jgi:mannose-6-phosphate isomerase-like protein (cupin superfamily)
MTTRAHQPRKYSFFTIAVSAVVTACAAAPTLPDPLSAGWQGEPVCERLHENSDQRILRCTFPPGVGHERHFHAPNFGYAIEGGRMRITDDNGVREVDLPTGSSFTSEGVAWHEVLNIGSTSVIYLIVERK